MKTQIILLIATVIFVSSCGNPHCERGEGRTVSETYTLGEFNGIDISSWGEVEIIKSNEHKLEIHAQANVIDRFRVNVRNETLYIGADCFNARSKPKLYIYCKSFNDLRLSGAGKIESSSEFIFDNLNIEMSGAGDIGLRGEAEQLSIRVSGSGDVNLMGLQTKNADIRISGKSDCSVFVVDHLQVKISGVGKVYYKGNPEIDQEISGVGKVISKN
ncbi:MAG TPA: head GIN domain-containing protein [Cytophagales bacterium]|nr:head GIN domain-containing protein [Cytophagales bacterium]